MRLRRQETPKCRSWQSIAFHQKGLMGIWIAENEGAKFRLNVLAELQRHGLEDIPIVYVDGLKGFPDAISAVFSQTHIQSYIMHMVHNSLKYVLWTYWHTLNTLLNFPETSEGQFTPPMPFSR